ncbi:MAG: DUF3034 family protein, partial [Pseudomonadales bacterium]|nr:DUF3034 family protein [Pseudomonadales bacterium]
MPATASSQEGKLLATPVVTQFEGAGGGGLVPFATLAGYASDEDIAVNGFATRLNVDEFDLTVKGMSFNYHDRVELSLATQKLGVDPLALDIRQQVAGIKVRLYGDIVYSAMPQVSVGLQHKKLKDKTVARAVGADKLQDTDIYLA